MFAYAVLRGVQLLCNHQKMHDNRLKPSDKNGVFCLMARNDGLRIENMNILATWRTYFGLVGLEIS
jgi:hypothetical protein